MGRSRKVGSDGMMAEMGAGGVLFCPACGEVFCGELDRLLTCESCGKVGATSCCFSQDMAFDGLCNDCHDDHDEHVEASQEDE
jgi:hypothetical protein